MIGRRVHPEVGAQGTDVGQIGDACDLLPRGMRRWFLSACAAVGTVNNAMTTTLTRTVRPRSFFTVSPCTGTTPDPTDRQPILTGVFRVDIEVSFNNSYL